MDTGYGDPRFLQGLTDPYEQKEDPTKRSWGELATDVGTKLVVDPLLGVARGATTVGRELQDDPTGKLAEADRAVAQAQEWARTKALSPYQRQTDQSKFFGGDKDTPSAWERPLGVITSAILPSVLGIVATAGAGAIPAIGMRAASGIATAAGAGFGATSTVAQMRDLAERTPTEDLNKSPLFQKAMIDNGGDETAARQQFFKDSFDTYGVVANAIANGLQFHAVTHYLPEAEKLVASRMWRAMGGALEGGAAGFAGGAAGEFAQQRQKIKAGLMDQHNLTDIAAAGGEGAMAFAPLVGGMKALQRAPGSGNSGLGTDVEDTITKQLTGPGKQLALPPPIQAMLTGAPQGQLTDQRFNMGDQTATPPPEGGGPGVPALTGPVVMPPSRQLTGPSPFNMPDERPPTPPMLTGPPAPLPPSQQLTARPDIGGATAPIKPPRGGGPPEGPGGPPEGPGGGGPVVPPAPPVAPAGPAAAPVGPSVAAAPAGPVVPVGPVGPSAAAIATSAPAPVQVATAPAPIAPVQTAPAPVVHAPAPTAPAGPGQVFITGEHAQAIDNAMKAKGPARSLQVQPNGDLAVAVIQGPERGTVVPGTAGSASPTPSPGLHPVVIRSPNNFEIHASVPGRGKPSEPFRPDPSVDQEKLVRMRGDIFDMKPGDAMVFPNGNWWRMLGRGDVDEIAIDGSDGSKRATDIDAAARGSLRNGGRIVPRTEFEKANAPKPVTPGVKTPTTIGEKFPELGGVMTRLQKKQQQEEAERTGRYAATPGVHFPEKWLPQSSGKANVPGPVQLPEPVVSKVPDQFTGKAPALRGEKNVRLAATEQRTQTEARRGVSEGTKLTDHQQKLRDDIAEFHRDAEQGVYPPIKAEEPDVFYTAAERKADPSLKSTGIYARSEGPRGGYETSGSQLSMRAAGVKPPERKPMSDKEFNDRRAALLRRARRVDNAMGGNVFELSLPHPREKAASTNKRFDDVVGKMRAHQGLSPDDFVAHPEVVAARTELRDINVARMDSNQKPLPVPKWINDKIDKAKPVAHGPDMGAHVNAYQQHQKAYEAARVAAEHANRPTVAVDVDALEKAHRASELARLNAMSDEEKADLATADDRPAKEITKPTVRLLVEAARLQEEREAAEHTARQQREARQQKRPVETTRTKEQEARAAEARTVQEKLEAARKAEQPTLTKNKQVDPVTKEEIVKGKALLARYFAMMKRRAKMAAQKPGNVYDVHDVLKKVIKTFRDRIYNERAYGKKTAPSVVERDDMARKTAVEGLDSLFNVPHANPAEVFQQLLLNINEHAGTPYPIRPKSLDKVKKIGARRGEADTSMVKGGEDRITGETEKEQSERQTFRKELQDFYRSQYRAFQIARQNLMPYLQFVINGINEKGTLLNEKNGGKFDYRLPMGTMKKGFVEHKLTSNSEKLDYYNFGIELQKIAERIRQIDALLKDKSVSDIMKAMTSPGDADAPVRRALRSFASEMTNFVMDAADFTQGRMENIRERRHAETNLVGEQFLYRVQDQFDKTDSGESIVSATDRYTPILQDKPATPLEQIERAEAQGEPAPSRPARTASRLQPNQRNMQPRTTSGVDEIPIKWTTPEAERAYKEGQANLYDRKKGIVEGKEEVLPGQQTAPAWWPQSWPWSPTRAALLHDHDPVSDDISQRESASRTIRRVKAMIRDGRTDMSKFVTEDFLDKLSRLLGNETHIYHTKSEALGRGSKAWYDPSFDRIVVSADVNDRWYAATVVHELVHAATEHLVHTDDQFHAEVNRLLEITRDMVERAGLDKSDPDRRGLLYGLRNPSEFLAESRSSREFRDVLSGIPSRGMPVVQPGQQHNIVNSLYRAVQKVMQRMFGRKDGDTALDALYADQSTVLGRMHSMIDAAIERQTNEGGRDRGPYARRYEPKQVEGKEGIVNAKLFDNLRGYAADKLERTSEFVRKGGLRERGFAMPLKTTFDIAQEGHLTTQHKANAILDVMSKTFADRNRMIREQDDPVLQKAISWYRKLSESAREKVGGFLFDETFHGAYADASLNSRRNSHLQDRNGRFVRTLANEQIAQNHPEMQRRYADVRKIAGFDEHRKLMHEFFSDREREIRDTVSRAYIANSDIIPESYQGKARMDVADELRQWTFQTSQGGAQRAYRSLLAKGIDVLDPDTRRELNDIRGEDAFRHIPGPYFPLTRRGDYAVSGTFNFPQAHNATRPPQEVHWQTKKPIDDGTYLFNREQDARNHVKFVGENFGATQLNGGVHYYDNRTGQRMRIMDDDEAERMKLLKAAGIDTRNRLLTKTEAEARIATGDPNIRKKYFVQYQNKMLEFHHGEHEADKSHREWQQQAAEWKKKHGVDVLDLVRPGDVVKGDPRQNEQYVSAQFQKMIDRYENTRAYRNLDAEEQRANKYALSLAAAKTTMHRGVRQRFQPRGYVQGASHDIPAALSEYSAQTAGYLAKMKHQPEANEATKSLTDYVGSMRDHKNYLHIQRVANEMLRRLHTPSENHLDTFWGRMTDRLLKVTMFDKLAGAAYLAINATEPWVVAGPLLTGRHPPWSVIRQMHAAYRMANGIDFAKFGAKDVWSAVKGDVKYTQYGKEFMRMVANQKDRAGLQRMLNAVGERGLFESAAGIEVQRSFLKPTNAFDRALEWGSNVFQGANTAVENLNRFVVAVATYRLEMAKHGNEDLAVSNTVKMMYKANGQYANFNSPTLFNKGPLGRAAFQFKKYPQRMMMNYYRAVVGSLRGEHKMENARTLLSMMVMQGMVAGALGMPTEPFSIPVNAMNIMGLSPYNWDDATFAFRQALDKAVGKDAAELIAHGALRLTGVDVSGRMGQESMFTRGSPVDPKNLPTAAFGLIFGAGGTTLMDFVAGANDIAKGVSATHEGADHAGWKLIRSGFKKIIPVRAASDVLDAVTRGEPEGMQNMAGRPMRKPYTTGQQVLAGTGLRTGPESESMEASRDVTRAKQVYDQQKKTWRDLWVQSTPAEQAKMWPSIQAWNARQQPGQGLTRSTLQKAGTTRAKGAQQDPALLGMSITKETKPFLKRAEAYNLGS